MVACSCLFIIHVANCASVCSNILLVVAFSGVPCKVDSVCPHGGYVTWNMHCCVR
jgi:hypothetical protein